MSLDVLYFKMKIGNTEIKDGIFLAPMAGVSDRAFRTVCRSFGAQMCIGEMVSAKAVHYKDKKTAVLARIAQDDTPCAVQIFGCEPDIRAEAAELLATNTYAHCTREVTPSYIDINMGCPVKKVVNNGEGSALMRNPELAGKIVRFVVDRVKIPVTVKIRAGWDENSKNAVLLAQTAQENGAAAVTVHGRTREQMYRDPVDRDIIRECKKALKIPVIANGGVMCAEDAVSLLEYTGCDGVMVARGAMGNPFIFREITDLLNSRAPVPATDEERIETAKKQILLMVQDKGERIAVCEARKHVCHYLRGMRGSSGIRGKVTYASTLDEMFSLLDEILKN